jgi:hypothetical protein
MTKRPESPSRDARPRDARTSGAPEPSRPQRHEYAEPEAGGGEAIEAAVWGQRIEILRDETVDGDFNGAPELAGIEASQDWEGVDVVHVMERGDAGSDREDRSLAAVLEERVAAQRGVLLARVAEAHAVGLGDLFGATLAATAPDTGEAPLVADTDVLRERLARIDAALERLEVATAGGLAAPSPRHEDALDAPDEGDRERGQHDGVVLHHSTYNQVTRRPWVALLMLIACGVVWSRARSRR